jgi:hypothetical protein
MECVDRQLLSEDHVVRAMSDGSVSLIHRDGITIDGIDSLEATHLGHALMRAGAIAEAHRTDDDEAA